ncbi:sensor histidine kinase [Nocardia neocaledoniensis]|uniref:sensor histidine kinase n=1 Tax=Nocardia neocaledoniensis TaxID=236511 RepID=UPI002453FEDB|nr:ATP-binding protein [Nocardia neocaledoniensis]
MQDERTTTLLVLGGDSRASLDLAVDRAATDAAVQTMGQLASGAQRLDSEAIARLNTQLSSLLPKIPTVREAVDARSLTADADGLYSGIVEAIADAIEVSAVNAPQTTTVTDLTITAALLRIADLHSRTIGLVAADATREGLRQSERRTITQLVGTYREQLRQLDDHLTESETERYRALTASPAWRTISAEEDHIAEFGQLSIPQDEWLAAERTVSSELFDIFRLHFVHATNGAGTAADTSFKQALIAGFSVLIIAVGSFLLAFVGANRLVQRLRRLRSRCLELANEGLPSLIRRLHDGEEVDVDAETAVVDEGSDELGQVADAFSRAQRAAMTAAAAEARTRDGFNKVFLDIAFRTQTVVRRQLDILDIAESKQDDPDHLELLFKLDHLTTRARRNAENLLILGGKQPGRRWRTSVSLEDIVRSAASETEGFARVVGVRLPDIQMLGGSVADLIHLLAELIDNAATFSPPDAPISVRGNRVGRGVAVEVEDQGVGIRPDDRDRLNDLLQTPPEFQELAVAGRRHLGLFVVGRLAQRHGISVSLQESAYGGVKAIVLIPAKLLNSPEIDEATRPVALPASLDDALEASNGVVRRPVRHRLDESTSGSRGAAIGYESQTPEAGTAAGRASVPKQTRLSSVPMDFPAQVSPGRSPLPRRQRQSHLAPQLQIDNSAPSQRPVAIDSARSAEQARAAMSSFQAGTQQARTSSAGHTTEMDGRI